MEELVEKVKNGDKEAYSILIQDVKVELYSIAKSKAINEEDIKDILQETILSGYLNINQLKENKHFKTWLIRILINECNKFYRNQKMEKALNQHYLETVSNNKGTENNIDIEDIISELDYLEKKIFKLYYEDKYTAKEISRILGIKTNTIKSKIRRGRKKIENKYRKGFIAIIILFILTTGVVFGKDIISYIISLFDSSNDGHNNDNILNAIEDKNWVQTVNMDYIKINDKYSIKIDYLLIDEMNLYIIFNFNSIQDLEQYYRISLTDLKITADNDIVLADEGTVGNNVSSFLTGWKNIEHNANNIRELVYFISGGYPDTKEINISFSKIIIYGDRGSHIEVNCEDTINIKIPLEEKFIDKTSIEYDIPISKTETFEIQKAVLTDTGLYAIIKTSKGKPEFIIEDADGNIYQCERNLINLYDEENNFYYLIVSEINEDNYRELFLINKKNKSEAVELIAK